MDFAPIFQRGGFDLQVGNPPWVKPVWEDDIALAELDPYFLLQDKIPERTFNRRRELILEPCSGRVRYLGDLAAWAGTAEHLGSTVEHSVLAGIQTNLYTNFMERVWRSAGNRGVSGLIHPESHFVDPKGGSSLRSQTYGRLRRHWQFLNELFLFEDVNHKTAFGVHVYAAVRTPSFLQMSYLLAPIDG